MFSIDTTAIRTRAGERSTPAALRVATFHAAFHAALLLTCLLIAPSVFASSPPVEEDPTDELIVRLAPGAYGIAPQALVERVQQRTALPGALATAAPESARLAVRAAAAASSSGLAAETASSHPRARLGRFVVLSFPPGTDLEATRETLLADPEIEHVERNKTMRFDVPPNDPLLPITPDPTEHQWGAHLMNLPAAWERMRGQAYLGVIDTGLDPNHPDLRPFAGYSTKGGSCGYAAGPFEGGNFRPHLSWDFGDDDCDVSEDQFYKGHGTHVAGIVAATTDNGVGPAGHCWNCSLMITKATTTNLILTYDAIASSLVFLVDRGVQSVSMSFGLQDDCTGAAGVLCTALELAAVHDVVLTASSGNDKRDINFPASDPRVLAIGGLQPGGAFWDEETIDTFLCPCDRGLLHPNLCAALPTAECGSNYQMTPGSAEQTLVVPARSVASTFFPGEVWNPDVGCTDAALAPAGDGYGLCTGTSMSAPAASALAGLVRSVNPLLDRDEVAGVLTTTASLAGSGDPRYGHGVPDAAAAVEHALGTVDGEVVENRITPLFSLRSTSADTHLFTTVPQQAQAAFFDPELDDFVSVGGSVPYYLSYPEVPECHIGPCPPRHPTASVALLVSHVTPGPGYGTPLPLYRLSYDAPFGGNALNRSFAYAVSQAEVTAFAQVGYRVDGLEGYLLPRCSPEPSCQPDGTTPLHRLYHAGKDDYVIVPAGEVSFFSSQGYAPLGAGYPEILGYAFTLDDADGDQLADGFEALIGTDPVEADSDCDGVGDGVELPPAGVPLSDPLDGGCGADLAASVSTTPGQGGQWDVTTGTLNLGPGDAQGIKIDVLFESNHWDWYIPRVPFGCTSIDPPKGTIILGTWVHYRCTLGSLAAGHSRSRVFGVTPSQDPSTLDITVTTNASTDDDVPGNDVATGQLNGGLLQ